MHKELCKPLAERSELKIRAAAADTRMSRIRRVGMELVLAWGVELCDSGVGAGPYIKPVIGRREYDFTQYYYRGFNLPVLLAKLGSVGDRYDILV